MNGMRESIPYPWLQLLCRDNCDHFLHLFIHSFLPPSLTCDIDYTISIWEYAGRVGFTNSSCKCDTLLVRVKLRTERTKCGLQGMGLYSYVRTGCYLRITLSSLHRATISFRQDRYKNIPYVDIRITYVGEILCVLALVSCVKTSRMCALRSCYASKQ